MEGEEEDLALACPPEAVGSVWPELCLQAAEPFMPVSKEINRV